MELKLAKSITIVLPYCCSNRTFMELKLVYQKARKVINGGSNRTFMELK